MESYLICNTGLISYVKTCIYTISRMLITTTEARRNQPQWAAVGTRICPRDTELFCLQHHPTQFASTTSRMAPFHKAGSPPPIQEARITGCCANPLPVKNWHPLTWLFGPQPKAILSFQWVYWYGVSYDNQLPQCKSLVLINMTRSFPLTDQFHAHLRTTLTIYHFCLTCVRTHTSPGVLNS